MTSNDEKTLQVEFDPCADNVFPLTIRIVDNRNYQTCIRIRLDDVEPLMACLSLPVSIFSMRLVTMTGYYFVKWWNYHELAFVSTKRINGVRLATVLQHKEAMELATMIKHEIACDSSISTSNPLAGAQKRTNDNLRGVFA